MESLWIDGFEKTNFPQLKGNIKTDVLIIGGGITGILCAYMLKNAGVDCVLVEAKSIYSGITKNTTAKITLQHGLLYDKLIKQFGVEKAALYLKAQNDACLEYEKLCATLDCDYEKKDAYVYSINDAYKIEREVEAYHRLKFKAEFCEGYDLPFDVAGAVLIKNQAQFHPLKFLSQIAKDLPIYENTKVKELMPKKAITEYGEIDCKKMIVATHFPLLNKHGSYFLKLYQHRSYVLALENAVDVCGMYVDENLKGLSFRNYKGLLLLGGGSHRTGKNGGNWRELKAFANKYYPSSKIRYKWATQDCMSLDGVPYIGQYSKSTPDLFVATGFNKWGMTSSMVAAKILTDLVNEKKNEYASVFSPSRSILRPQLAVNAFESIMGLLTPTAPRCPHLGCALKYNKDEHSWDCSCHGSRFTQSGEVIDNPATDDIKRSKKMR